MERCFPVGVKNFFSGSACYGVASCGVPFHRRGKAGINVGRAFAHQTYFKRTAYRYEFECRVFGAQFIDERLRLDR